jgi:hypothetical protein
MLLKTLKRRSNLVEVDADGRIILNHISVRYSGNM